MPEDLKPIRRVVTGNDELGRSRVVWDGPPPNFKRGSGGRASIASLWVWYDSPAPLSGEHDDGN